MLPAAVPQIFAGMRTSLSLAVIIMVISEYGRQHERRRLLVAASRRTRSQITTMWAAILLIGLIGYLLNLFFSLVERRVLAWHSRLAGARMPQ